MGTFFISPETGQLKLIESLDREKKDLYRLTLVATDNGAHRLSSEAEVMVNYIVFRAQKLAFMIVIRRCNSYQFLAKKYKALPSREIVKCPSTQPNLH